ncbi:MAG: hypothetical protein KDK75_08600 [Alphaproteobacteria bacterium]|nr:hypothetical protein [Alphaproteobacteria bacterium]
MRVEMMGCALAASVLFSGPVPGLNGALTHVHVKPPGWLAIPADANIVAIDFAKDGEGKKSRGTIVARPSGDTVEVVKSITSNLAEQGFDLAQPTLDFRYSGSVRTMISAYDDIQGRSAAVVVKAGVTGGELLISFAGSRID